MWVKYVSKNLSKKIACYFVKGFLKVELALINIWVKYVSKILSKNFACYFLKGFLKGSFLSNNLSKTPQKYTIIRREHLYKLTFKKPFKNVKLGGQVEDRQCVCRVKISKNLSKTKQNLCPFRKGLN